MPATEVLAVLEALERRGCWVALEGGWGVDALAGRQTRLHRDVDVDVDAAQERVALSVLEELGYAVETDQRPTRVELVAPRGRRVDVHPLRFDAAGDGVQTGLCGEQYRYPATSFVTGCIDGRPVRCLSVAQQIEWHAGYAPRESDRADLVVLHDLVRDGHSPGW
ncbi:amino acid transporter [Modestobacter sp. I12A-02628]|uniref:Nucleotidyltransferase family protein n=2 Tax=Goekera deserti TaxID=2497753 RepID=A0A7K3WER2_9ACTN|nr:amino acid transporter [Goekera deserti]NDI46831.1 amino acid transporter [Goekera deserti]NEL54399.1 nucleotidyltransferase family protein [Goekera deserti]